MINNLAKLIFVALLALPSQLFASSESNQNFNKNPKNFTTKLEIVSQNNKKITEFFVAVANDEGRRISGLMNLEKLPIKSGMIFIFDYPEIVQMWMKNTMMPLDMIFIRGNEIVRIVENAVPFSEEIISSQNLVDKVLEINGGEAARRKLRVGNKIKLYL